MWIRYILTIVVAASAGFAVSAAAFAAIAAIGIIPRLAGRTKTADNIKLYEASAVWGGILGNIVNLYNVPLFGGQLLNILFGVSSGIFVGCLAVALAELLNTIPIFSRRIGLFEGGEYIILAMALGKTVGALLYFINGW